MTRRRRLLSKSRLLLAVLMLGAAVCGARSACPAGSDEPRQDTTPPPYTPREYRAETADGVSLHCVFYEPRLAPPWPTLVMVAGSGPSPSTSDPSTRLLVDTWSRAGIATLAFDKRGAGGSGGTSSETDFEQGAADVSSVVRLARTIAGVDTTRVGLWGISQAGWILPRLASVSHGVHFLVMVSPAGVNPAEQVGFYLAGEFRKLGLTASEVDQAVALFDQIGRYYATGTGYEAVKRALGRVATQPWYSKVEKHPFWYDMKEHARPFPPKELPAAKAAKPDDFAWTSAPSTYADYSADYRSIDIPTLIIYGGKDELVPTERSRGTFQRAFGPGERSSVTFRVFPEGDHNMRVSPSAVAAGYREVIRDFVLGQHVQH